MDIQHDVTLEYALQDISKHPGKTALILLTGLGSEIRMQATETPGEYLVAIWSIGPEPFQKTEAVTVTGLQFAALFKPLIDKNHRILELQGALVAAEAEKFLRELADGE